MNIVKQQWNGDRLNVSSAWRGLEFYMNPIIEQFKITPKIALEFGVDLGYSSHIFSQIFDKVIGIDKFDGDEHIHHVQDENFYQSVISRFKNTNVDIIKSDFRDFILYNENKYDLIHIDIVHLYNETYECAEWAIAHSDVVLLHDTCSFSCINDVCMDISKKFGVGYYNIPEYYGLGILYKI